MKRLIFLIILLFSYKIIGFASSFQLEKVSPDVFAGETFIAKIKANIMNDIKKENIRIFEERRELFFEKDFYRGQNESFFYIIFPKKGNYSIIIENLVYKEHEDLKEVSLNFSLEVKENNNSLRVYPGFIWSNKPYVILTNLGNNETIVELQGKKINLGPLEEKKIEIEAAENFFYLEIKSYKKYIVPVIFIGNIVNKTENNSLNYTINQSKDKGVIEIEAEKTELILSINENKTSKIKIKNKYNKTLNVSIEYTIEKIKIEKKEEFIPFEEKDIEIFFLYNKTGVFQENISITWKDGKKIIPMTFYVVNENEKNTSLEEKNCKDYGGVICNLGEDCINGTRIPIIGEGMCCIAGQCKKLNQNKKKNYLAGIFFILLGLILTYFIIKKAKNFKAKSKLS